MSQKDELMFLPINKATKEQKKELTHFIERSNPEKLGFPLALLKTCKHQCSVILINQGKGIVVNVFFFTEKLRPFDYGVIMMKPVYLNEIWDHIFDNYRHEFWTQTPSTSNKFIAKGNNWYADNRPKVFVSPLIGQGSQRYTKNPNFKRYNLVPYNKCEIAVVDERFRRKLADKKHIILTSNRECENFVAIVCYNIEQVFEYIDAPTLKTSGFQTPNTCISRTYTTMGYFGMSKFYLHKKLRGFDLVPKGADYIRVEYNRKNYDSCKIKNNLILNNIQKHILKDLLPQWMMRHVTLEDLDNFYRGDADKEESYSPSNSLDSIYIAKPSSGREAYGGRGIHIISNYETYLTAREVILASPDSNYVIQKYITNPVLFKGKKCHLRMYILVTSWGECFYHDRFKIMTAKKEYSELAYKNNSSKLDNPNYQNSSSKLDSLDNYWLDKDIHDSHLGSTDNNYYYPDDKEFLGDDSFKFPHKKVKKLFEDIVSILQPSLYKDECQYGYRILGADLMMSNDLDFHQGGEPGAGDNIPGQNELILLEINHTPGTESLPLSPGIKPFCHYEKDYLEWEYSCIEKYL